MNKHTYN